MDDSNHTQDPSTATAATNERELPIRIASKVNECSSDDSDIDDGDVNAGSIPGLISGTMAGTILTEKESTTLDHDDNSTTDSKRAGKLPERSTTPIKEGNEQEDGNEQLFTDAEVAQCTSSQHNQFPAEDHQDGQDDPQPGSSTSGMSDPMMLSQLRVFSLIEGHENKMDLRANKYFPTWRNLPKDEPNRGDPIDKSKLPPHHWCFLATIIKVEWEEYYATVKTRDDEIVNVMFTRISRNFKAPFHMWPGQCIAVLYGRRSWDTAAVGTDKVVRVDQIETVASFPGDWDAIMTLSDKIQGLAMDDKGTVPCHGCKERKNPRELHRCLGCFYFSYCQRDCQKGAWQSHSLDCEMLRRNEELRQLFELEFSDWSKPLIEFAWMKPRPLLTEEQKKRLWEDPVWLPTKEYEEAVKKAMGP